MFVHNPKIDLLYCKPISGLDTLNSPQHIATPATSGYQVWTDVTFNNVVIGSDINTITLFVMSSGFNINYMKFDLVVPSSLIKTQSVTDVNLIRAVRSENQTIFISLENKLDSPVTITGVELFDASGSKIASQKSDMLLETLGQITLNAPKGMGLGLVRVSSNMGVSVAKVRM